MLIHGGAAGVFVHALAQQQAQKVSTQPVAQPTSVYDCILGIAGMILTGFVLWLFLRD
jgi:hypothetical protein